MKLCKFYVPVHSGAHDYLFDYAVFWFGGATTYDAKGGYMSSWGNAVNEEIRVIEIGFRTHDDYLKFLYEFRNKMAASGEEAIAYTDYSNNQNLVVENLK